MNKVRWIAGLAHHNNDRSRLFAVEYRQTDVTVSGKVSRVKLRVIVDVHNSHDFRLLSTQPGFGFSDSGDSSGDLVTVM